MKKYVLDLKVSSVERVNARNVLIKLTDEKPLPEMLPGQFVEVRVDGSPSTFLRRPISINFVDKERNELWLLVATVGEGTRTLARLREGDMLNCVLPLGNTFAPLASPSERVLLVGGGVGVAPLLYFGKDKGGWWFAYLFVGSSYSSRLSRSIAFREVWKGMYHYRGWFCR